jgi:hypothetical protein
MAQLFHNIPTGEAVTYLNTLTETLPTSMAEPIQAAGAALIPTNPQSPMVAQPPQPLAVMNPSDYQEPQEVAETPKAATNTMLVGALVLGGLGLMLLRRR